MKFYKRLLCALLCCSLFVGVSSVSANATETEITDYFVYISTSTNTSGGVLGSAVVNMADGEATMVRSNQSVTIDKNTTAYATMYLGVNSGEYLFRSDSAVNMTINNIYCRFAWVTNGVTYYVEPTVQVAIEYMDGSVDYDVEENLVFTSDDKSESGIDFSFVPADDVYKIHITYMADIGEYYTSIASWNEGKIYITCGENVADEHFILMANQQSEEAGLLEKVISKLQGLWDGILSLPEKIKDSLSGFFDNLSNKLQGLWDSILELPNKIWSAFEDGLIGFILPDEQYLIQYKDKWVTILEDRLGAVWQVVELTYGAWEEIEVSDVKNTIEIPLVTIPLPDDNSFSFGGYSVPIVPEGFEPLAASVKMIAGILCTLLFINGLRSRYDEVMGVEK